MRSGTKQKENRKEKNATITACVSVKSYIIMKHESYKRYKLMAYITLMTPLCVNIFICKLINFQEKTK